MKKLIIILIASICIGHFVAVDTLATERGIKVSARTTSGKTIPLYSDSYALVIGNGNYTKGWDPLPGAIRDVKDVARVLRDNGFNVTLKTNLTRYDFNRDFGNFFYKYVLSPTLFEPKCPRLCDFSYSARSV